MATTSIWRVKGWLGKVLIYVENPDKTENPAAFEKQGMDGQEAQGLSDVIEYAARQEKTGRIAPDEEGAPVMQRFVSGVNCSPSTARDEMMAVKKRFGKEDGTVAYHGYQSFAPGEATPELAHEIGLALAKKLWGEKYQVLVATHLDKAHHLHNHFVVNTVSFVDGIKYYRSEKDYFAMQRESDRLCREYGLSVIENPQRGKSKHYGEWRAEQEGRPTYLSLIKADVDAAIRQSMTERHFFIICGRWATTSRWARTLRCAPTTGPTAGNLRATLARAIPWRTSAGGFWPRAAPSGNKRRSRNGAGSTGT